MYYRRNKEHSRTRTVDPTLTDQAGAIDTDINVIVRRFGLTGTMPGRREQPMYEDFTQLPNDLRGMIERTRELNDLYHKLPKELQALSLVEIATLTNDQLATKLPKPATPPAEVTP